MLDEIRAQAVRKLGLHDDAHEREIEHPSLLRPAKLIAEAASVYLKSSLSISLTLIDRPVNFQYALSID